jgi:hypothetical protein
MLYTIETNRTRKTEKYTIFFYNLSTASIEFDRVSSNFFDAHVFYEKDEHLEGLIKKKLIDKLFSNEKLLQESLETIAHL